LIRWRHVSAVCGLVGLGCGGSAAPVTRPQGPSCGVPDSVQLELEASDRVNIDETGRALPTRLRLYQLSDLSKLEGASFDDLWSRADATLANTRVSSQEIIVYPGQVAVHRFNRESRADFLVGVAIFREPEGEAWRTAQEWPAPGDPCRASGVRYEVPPKLRVRMFLEDSRIDSVSNFAELPKRRCPPGAPCAALPNELGRSKHLRTFEEDAREPEQLPSD
jgi:type VI secretion system VasD/TssJ family lipoprotein